MKRFVQIIAAAIALCAASSAAAVNPKIISIGPDWGYTVIPSKNIVTEKRTSAMNFTKIEVSGYVSLTVEERNDNIIVIRTPENLMPYLKLSVSNGVLEAGLEGVRISRKYENASHPVEIFIPDNGRIEGIDVSAVSKVEVLPRIGTAAFSADVSGVSVLNVNVASASARFDVSGASAVKFESEGSRLSVDASGSSSVSGSVRAVKSVIDVSGASSVTLEGLSESAEIEVSGVSGFNGGGMKTTVCTVEATGCSSAEVLCSGSLSAEAYGMSAVTYSGECRLSSVSTSGMSNVKKR